MAWSFLSNHALVLQTLARTPTKTMRAVAEEIGITERGVQRVVAELEKAGYLERSRPFNGRRNWYELKDCGPRRAGEPLELMELLLGVRIDPSTTTPV